MFRTVVNKLLLVLYFVLGALVLEAFTFHILELGFMPVYFDYNLAIIMIVAVLVFLIPNYVAEYVVFTILLTIQVVFIYINYSLTKIYGDLFSIDMLRMIGEAGAAITTNFIYFAVILQLIAIFAAIIVFGAIVLKYCKKDKNTAKYHFSIFNIIIILSVQCFGAGCFISVRNRLNSVNMWEDAYLMSDTFLMNTSLLKTRSYQTFGTYGYFSNLVANYVRKDGETIQNATLNYFNEGSKYGVVDNTSDVFGIDANNNVIVIMMESLEWFGFGDGTYSKDFSIDKDLAPNVYSLVYGDSTSSDINQNSPAMTATSFFAKSKTNISEGQGIVGNYPVGQGLPDVIKYDTNTAKALGYSLPNILKQQGYTTAYVHSNEITYYDRDKTHHSLGFDTVIGKDGLKDEDGHYIYTGDELIFDNWEAEGKLVENAIDYIVPTNCQTTPFYTFFLNVSSHGPYDAKHNVYDGDAQKYYYYIKYGADDCETDANGNYKLNKNESLATYSKWYNNVLQNHPLDSKIAEEMVYYQCGVKGLDDAIGVIIKKLVDYGVLDNTTLLLYSDHNAYYSNLSNRMKGIKENDLSSIELNTIPMIISSPGLKNYNTTATEKITTTDRFCSAYDVVPTLMDLLGISFNENLYMGQSLFKPLDSDMVVYYSNTGGIFSKEVCTFDFNTFITSSYDEEKIELFKTESKNMLRKLNYLSFLNKYNLYPKLTNV